MQAKEKKIDKRRLRGEKSRQLILQAAISCIAALGLGNTTLDRVASRAGTSRALVVFHFKSKNGLLEEVLSYLGARYAEGWYAMPDASGDSNIEKIWRLVEYDIRFAYEHPEYVSAWHAFWGEARGNLLYQNISFSRDEAYADDLEHLIAAVIKEGGYDRKELKPISTALSAMLFGVWTESHLNPNPEDCRRYLKAMRLFLAKVFPDHQEFAQTRGEAGDG